MRRTPIGRVPLAWLVTATLVLFAAGAGRAGAAASGREPLAAARGAGPCPRSVLRVTERAARAALGTAVAAYGVRNDGRGVCSLADDTGWARWLAGPDRLVSYTVRTTASGSRLRLLDSGATAFVTLHLDTVAAPTRTAGVPPGVPSTGYDISWPQCGGRYPPPPYWVAVIGLNDGRAFSRNPCLRSEASWARQSLSHHAAYLNLNSPVAVNATDTSGPAGRCAPTADGCLAYNYGYNNAAWSIAAAAGQAASAPVVWLDIEAVGRCTTRFPTARTGYWSCHRRLNAITIQGALDVIRRLGAGAAVYSTGYQWQLITGGYRPSSPPLALWTPGSTPLPSSCSRSNGFAGGVVRLRQIYPPVVFDEDETC